MPETKTQNQNQKYKARRGLSFLWLKILSAVNWLLNLFYLKQSQRYWGIVYDSLTKQPLDPVIVKLLYVDGREVETCVTDLAGRYGFLARPGKFKIHARRTNYAFPSRYAPGDGDGIYENLYHGEFFQLRGDYEVVGPNIPMDPLGQDWNQSAKLAAINKSPYFQYLFKMLAAILFWFGFILDGVYICSAFPKIPTGLYVIAAVYLLLLILAVSLPEARLWGKVLADSPAAPGESLFLELGDPRFPGMVFGKTAVKEDGKFLLRSNKGKYTLFISKLGAGGQRSVLGQMKVSVGRSGVLNSTIVLRQLADGY